MDENDEIDSEKMSKRKRNNQRVQMKYRCYHYCGCCSLTISFKMLELRIVDCPSIFSKKLLQFEGMYFLLYLRWRI